MYLELFAEKLDGVIVGTVDPDTAEDHDYTEAELNALTVEQIKGLAAYKGYTITKSAKAEIIEEFLTAQQA